MPKRMIRVRDPSHDQYNSQVGELFLKVNSSDHDVQHRALAMTDWQKIRESDVIALLAPLSTHPDVDVRQLVALQLAAAADLADDPRALQALVTLAADDDQTVRAAAAQSSYIANEFSLTRDGQSAKSLLDRFVDWRQEGETMTFSLRCRDIATAKRILAIVTGFSVREMTHRADEKQLPPPAAKPNGPPNEPQRLPDVIMDEELPQVLDLPRHGTPKAVMNVSKAPLRLPDVLIDE